jgi:GntR family transcriptional regulator/MocR family aminotransferase
MHIPLDRESTTPLYQQIIQFLQEEIRSGALLPDMRLPSTRSLAEGLGVNRITVTNAYAELESAGLIYGKTGSGYYVAEPLPLMSTDYPSSTARKDWPRWQQSLLSRGWTPVQGEVDRLARGIDGPDLITFSQGVGESRLFPADDFRKALQAVLRQDGVGALGYGDRRGYQPLRETITHILASQGVPTRPECILITSGSQQAVALVAHLLLRPGDVVLVESPSYVGVIDLFRSMDVRLLGVPMDEQGMRMDAVEDALRTSQPKLIYTIPTFHNPTGVCMSSQRRRQLVALADRYDVPILEDDFTGDLRYEGRTQPALKALDPGGRVIYVSTFSKVLAPALRVGFLVADGPVYERLVDCKRANDLATSNLIQRALQEYITVGRYQAHLRRACQVYGQRRDVMVNALAQNMPVGTSWIKPQGGLFIWVKLPNDLSANELYPLAGEERVTFTPGSYFYPGARHQPYMRLNFVMHPSDVIEEGIRRLGRAANRLLGQKRAGSHTDAPGESKPKEENFVGV